MSEKELSTLSRRLREIRESIKLSQMQLAVAAKVSLSVITQLEQGVRSDIKLSTAIAIAKALGVTIDELTHEPDPPPAGKAKRKG